MTSKFYRVKWADAKYVGNAPVFPMERSLTLISLGQISRTITKVVAGDKTQVLSSGVLSITENGI